MRNPFKRTKGANGDTIVSPAEEFLAFSMLLGIGLYAGIHKIRLRDEKTKRFRPHIWTDYDLARKIADEGGILNRKNH